MFRVSNLLVFSIMKKSIGTLSHLIIFSRSFSTWFSPLCILCLKQINFIDCLSHWSTLFIICRTMSWEALLSESDLEAIVYPTNHDQGLIWFSSWLPIDFVSRFCLFIYGVLSFGLDLFPWPDNNFNFKFSSFIVSYSFFQF